jgi:uncharacterized membrane protein YdbT with pleckstrin-like domain
MVPMTTTPGTEEQVLWQGTPSQVVNIKWFLLALLIIPIPIALWKWVETRAQEYTLTTERLRFRSGIFTKRTDDLELYRVRDTTIEEPFFYRLFGAGNLVMATSDRSHPTFTLPAVREPREIYEHVRRQVELMRKQKRVREVDME